MAHYAFLDENNIVTEVIVGIDETETIEGLDTETWYGNFRGQSCKRTSYNNNIRFNFAGIGFMYDEVRDAFISPEPDGNLGFDEETCQWIMPDINRE
jgi:predicted HTH transcriptional regulator